MTQILGWWFGCGAAEATENEQKIYESVSCLFFYFQSLHHERQEGIKTFSSLINLCKRFYVN